MTTTKTNTTHEAAVLQQFIDGKWVSGSSAKQIVSTNPADTRKVLATIEDIRAQGTDILTVGQYMRPSLKHLPIERFWTPEEFDEIGREARKMGFKFVESGPLVRSSYHAGRHRHGAEQKH